MSDTLAVSPLMAWLLAIRPRTLPAAVAPVIVGTALAVFDRGFVLLPALAALVCSMLLQIGVNLANDYFDYTKGIDAVERLGPVRVTQSGLIPQQRVKLGMLVIFLLAALVGVYLIVVGGWPILAVGAASIIAALAYSGGPYPLASHGLGDVFVFIFFGLVAVCGTYYVQALALTPLVVIASVPVGLLISAILVVNNLRDIDTDSRVGKRTLAVILGRKGSRIEYIVLLVLSYFMIVIIWLIFPISCLVFLPILSLPLAWKMTGMIRTQTGAMLNQTLAGTARLALVFSILLALGFILSI